MIADRLFILAGGLAGAAGVALSAAAAHSGGANTGTAASFLLAHAPVFLAVGLLGGNAVMRFGTAILFVAVLIFAGDLLMRDYAGMRLFPMAAPTGGTGMIVGWLIIAVSAMWRQERT